MKAPVKDKKKHLNKKGTVIKKGKPPPIRKEQVLVVAQEIKYARLLSGNEKKTRDRVLKALKKWLTNCFEKGYEFKEDDFTRVWKGLFYAVWMSDKPLIQEELCESIAGILDLFPAEELKHALLMTKAGFKTLATEWYGIDQHRVDKFLMLVRRYLRGSLRCLARCGWSVESCQKYAKMLSGSNGVFAVKTPHYARNALSMQLHIVDCFLEELAKVSEGEISPESMSAVLMAFTAYTCRGEVPALCAATRRVLTALLRQSEEGLQYADKTRAWQKMGCPEGGPDALVLVSDDEEDTEEQENGDATSDDEIQDREKPLDPRAGRVDVELPLLPVPAALLADTLREMLGSCTSKAHKRVKICLERFSKLAAGEYPLPVEAQGSGGAVAPVVSQKRSLRALHALETKIKSDTDELKLRGLSRKHRKRLLRKTRLGQSIVEEVETVQRASRHRHKNSEWLVESTNTKSGADKDPSNNENQIKKDKKQVETQKRKLDAPNGDVVVKKQKLGKKNKDSVKDSPKVEKARSKRIQEKNENKHTNAHKYKMSKVLDKKVEENVKSKKVKFDSPKLVINKLKNFSKQLKSDKKVQKDFEKIAKKNIEKKTFNKDVKQFEKTGEKQKLNAVSFSKVKTAEKQKSSTKDQTNFENDSKHVFETPKKVKFVLQNNSMQKPVDYYMSVRQSPSIPFDSTKKPNKTNLKPSTPSPINPFFNKKLRK